MFTLHFESSVRSIARRGVTPQVFKTMIQLGQKLARMTPLLLAAGAILSSFPTERLGAAELLGQDSDQPKVISRETLTDSAQKAIGIMERSATEYRNQRQCFSCHHQAVPVLAMNLAQSRGLTVDQENLQQQIEHTRAHLERGREDYQALRGQGGRADTAGWGLWTLEVAGYPVDETTQPVAEYLLDWQREMGHWSPPSQRPPTEASPFTTTYVALRGITYFAPEELKEARDARVATARAWLLEAVPADTEDRVFQLRSLQYIDAEEAVLQRTRDQLIDAQREDGGWGQTPEMASDPYATATALAALHESGRLPVSSPAYQQGLRYLLDSQLPDGSWHVVTRSKPVQLYFETGFPHGKDQFLSMAATAWSTFALLLAVERADKAE